MLSELINSWIEEISKEGHLPDNCKALYIGLFEREDGYTLHFIGSVEFDETDDDWACTDNDNYIPENNYLYTTWVPNDDWEIFQNQVIDIIQQIKSNGNNILSETKNVAVGFDSGNLNYIK